MKLGRAFLPLSHVKCDGQISRKMGLSLPFGLSFFASLTMHFFVYSETLDVDEFLADVAMHLRRREIKMLLSYIGISGKDIDSLLYDSV